MYGEDLVDGAADGEHIETWDAFHIEVLERAEEHVDEYGEEAFIVAAYELNQDYHERVGQKLEQMEQDIDAWDAYIDTLEKDLNSSRLVNQRPHLWHLHGEAEEMHDMMERTHDSIRTAHESIGEHLEQLRAWLPEEYATS